MSKISYRDKFDLRGKVAVVTGGAGILGQHFCAGLVESGATVAIVDLQEDKALELAQVLAERYKGKTIGIGCDVSDPESVRAMVAQVVAEFGKINILHNNAAGKSDDLEAFFAPFEEYSLDQWRKVMAVNLDGMFLVAQSVGKQMVAQNRGQHYPDRVHLWSAGARPSDLRRFVLSRSPDQHPSCLHCLQGCRDRPDQTSVDLLGRQKNTREHADSWRDGERSERRVHSSLFSPNPDEPYGGCA